MKKMRKKNKKKYTKNKINNQSAYSANVELCLKKKQLHTDGMLNLLNGFGEKSAKKIRRI